MAVINTDLLAWQWYRANLSHEYPWLLWGGTWSPDSIGDAVARSTQREDALVGATVRRYPVFFAGLMDTPVDVCAPSGFANLYRCIPTANP